MIFPAGFYMDPICLNNISSGNFSFLTGICLPTALPFYLKEYFWLWKSWRGCKRTKTFKRTLSKIADLTCLYNISCGIYLFLNRYLSFYAIAFPPGKFILTTHLNAFWSGIFFLNRDLPSNSIAFLPEGVFWTLGKLETL